MKRTEMINTLYTAITESSGIISMLVDYKQDKYDDLIYESFMNELMKDESVPLLESVNGKDKKAVKDIIDNLKGKIVSDLKRNGITTYKPQKFLRTIIGFIGTTLSVTGIVASIASLEAIPAIISALALKPNFRNMSSGIRMFWKRRGWQIIGIINVEDGNIKGIIDSLNNKYKEQLGDYKILYVKDDTIKSSTVFVNKMGFKNDKECYVLLIDKNIPAGFESDLKAQSNDIKELDNKYQNNIKESVEMSGFNFSIGNFKEGTSEFASGSNATNNVSNGVKGSTINVPGGLGEKPHASGDQNNIPVPGGLSEKPHANAVDGVTIPIPNGTDLNDDAYNAAISMLHKTLKECCDLMEVLESTSIKNKNMKESSEMNQMYKDYVTNFAESGVEGRPLSMSEFMEYVDTYIENDGDMALVEGKYSQYKKMVANKNEDRDKDDQLTPFSHKEFKANYKQSEELITGLYNQYKKIMKDEDRKPVARFKFRGWMMGEFQDFFNPAGSKGSSSNLPATVGSNEVGLSISASAKKNVAKLIGQVVSGKIEAKDTVYRQILDYFKVIPAKEALGLKESVDDQDVFDHFSSFLTESLPME